MPLDIEEGHEGGGTPEWEARHSMIEEVAKTLMVGVITAVKQTGQCTNCTITVLASHMLAALITVNEMDEEKQNDMFLQVMEMELSVHEDQWAVAKKKFEKKRKKDK